MGFTQSLLYMSLVVHFVMAQLYEGDDCELSGGTVSGKCAPLDECPSVMLGLQANIAPEMCGFEGDMPVICCPLAEIKSAPPASISAQKCRVYSTQIPQFLFLSVVGGVQSTPREFPHMAILGFEKDGNKEWRCGGSLVSEQYVLTAAHCLRSPELGNLTWARLGDLNLASDTDIASPQDFRITRLIPHPEHRTPSVYNDIAVVQLERPVQFSSFVKPACLHEDPQIAADADLVISGWGLMQFGGAPSDTLQRASLDLFTEAECNRTYANVAGSRRLRNGINQQQQFCAGGRDSERDACQGDSGGPLQIYREKDQIYSIVGITSFGKACGTANVPGVYTRVSYYVPWLESILWPNN